ncbi:MAG: HD domain-containing protein [Thermodesulfobacteria bacterium]|nr:HD domain-containing protein [Thermodesulfobacteriota bacterium]
MIPTNLITRIFEAASIQRWNDHVRPVELTELDKQAHKMLIAYMLGRFQEQIQEINWLRIIEGGFFEFLQRVVLTDIKPPVFHYLMKKAGKELNEYVLGQVREELSALKSLATGNPLINEMEAYLESQDVSSPEKRILSAAHYLATKWEFELVYNAFPKMYGIDETKREIEDKIEDYYELAGVQKILLGGKSHHFVDLVSQLRFQKRWSKTPRIPQTTVLGHMLVVAYFTYLLTPLCTEKPCKKRIYNNFFSALFHDLPEVYTRDIISPVKREVAGLEEVILEYEKKKLEEKILPLLPGQWHQEIVYFLEDQFKNKIMEHGRPKQVDEIGPEWNRDEFDPLDGTIIKIADEMAAYWEAAISLSHGIRSPHLEEAIRGLEDKYRHRPGLASIFSQPESS